MLTTSGLLTTTE